MRKIGALAGFVAVVFLGAGLRSISAETLEYSIQAIRYADLPDFPVAGLVMGALESEKIDIAMVVWLIRDGKKNILFDSGFHRESWFKSFPMKNFLRPDE